MSTSDHKSLQRLIKESLRKSVLLYRDSSKGRVISKGDPLNLCLAPKANCAAWPFAETLKIFRSFESRVQKEISRERENTEYMLLNLTFNNIITSLQNITAVYLFSVNYLPSTNRHLNSMFHLVTPDLIDLCKAVIQVIKILLTSCTRL